MTITSFGAVSNKGVRNQIIKRSTARQCISARSVIGGKALGGLDGQCKLKELLTLILQASDLPHKLTGFIRSDAGRNHSSSDPCSSPQCYFRRHIYVWPISFLQSELQFIDQVV